MNVISKLYSTTIGGILGKILETGAGSRRVRGFATTAGIYFGGNYAVDKMRENMIARKGEDSYQSQYAKGESGMRLALGATALGTGVVGGLLGRGSIISGEAWANRGKRIGKLHTWMATPGVAKPGSRSFIGPAAPIRLKNRTAWFDDTRRLIGAGVGSFGGGAYLGTQLAVRQPIAVEGTETSFFDSSMSDKLNFDTAGLVQALHDRKNRRM